MDPGDIMEAGSFLDSNPKVPVTNLILSVTPELVVVECRLKGILLGKLDCVPGKDGTVSYKSGRL